MNWLDAVFQTVLAIAGLTVMNRLLYQDSLVMSVAYAAAVTACFWAGRVSVRLLKRRRQLRGLRDE